MAQIGVRYVVHDVGGGQSMPDGTRPEPGGWNRIGGNQILLDDPSGNCVELFEPKRD